MANLRWPMFGGVAPSIMYFMFCKRLVEKGDRFNSFNCVCVVVWRSVF